MNTNNSGTKKNRLPTKKECESLNAWHLPWNKKKYKKKCSKKKCIWKQSLFGSYCKDPKTVTDENLDKQNLNNDIYLATLLKSELKRILKQNNVADEKYLKKITKKYFTKRVSIIRDIVNRNLLNYLILCTEEELEKIVKNAVSEKQIKNVKPLNNLLLNREILQESCFISKLGYNKINYQYNTWEEVEEKLAKCGIRENDNRYLIARNMWETRNRPIMELKNVKNHDFKIVKKITLKKKKIIKK